MEARRDPAAVASSAATVEKLVANIARVVHAPADTLQLCVLGLLAEGHVIIEDFPGVGKTMLAKSLARSLDVDFSRIQFTPDLLPSDVTGVNVFNQRTNEFEFRAGPVFANVLLVDEINRASPKTQAALLEAMQENQVTIDGESYPLERPFIVLATQNPIEYEGTYPLPEAQLDRFSMRLSLGYPQLADEARMLNEQTTEPPLETLAPVAGIVEILAAIDEARSLFVEESLNRYVVALLRHTRASSRLALGASPRAGIALLRVAKARALADGRDYVLPDDVKAIARPVLAHRLILAPEARSAGLTAEEIVGEAVEQTPVPVVRRIDQVGGGADALLPGRRDLRRRLALRREGSLPGRYGARAGADRGAHLGPARGPADRTAAADRRRPSRPARERGPPLRGRGCLGNARGAAGGARAAALDLGHRADREARRAGHAAPARPRAIPRHLRDREGVARTLRRRGDEGDDRRPLRAGACRGRSRRGRLAPRLSAARRARSALFGEWGARTGRAHDCCCAVPRGSTCTRCANTSRASHCGRCTGGQPRGGAS